MAAKDGTHAGKNSHNQDAQDAQKAHTPLTDEEAAMEEVEQDAPNAFLVEELVTDEQHTKEGIRHSCNEHGTIYAILSDFGDRMTTQYLD